MNLDLVILSEVSHLQSEKMVYPKKRNSLVKEINGYNLSNEIG